LNWAGRLKKNSVLKSMLKKIFIMTG
jgi:hypothetical protein